MSDIKELKDKELEKVTGGWSQNEDGTYNIYEGEFFDQGITKYTACETKLNATLETFVKCEVFRVDENGNFKENLMSSERVGTILFGLNSFCF